MAHLSGDNKKLIARVRRIKGQLESVEKALHEGAECYSVLQTTAACRGAIDSLTRELILEHIEHHLIAPGTNKPEIQQASREVQNIIKSFLK